MFLAKLLRQAIQQNPVLASTRSAVRRALRSVIAGQPVDFELRRALSQENGKTDWVCVRLQPKRGAAPLPGAYLSAALEERHPGAMAFEFERTVAAFLPAAQAERETTAQLLPLLDSDLFAIMRAVREQRLAEMDIRWKDGAAACVVLASGGYPGKYEGGKPISGLEEAEAMGATVYHAGTKRTDAGYVTAGGRVLGVTALGDTLADAIHKAYAAAEQIHFDGAHMRRDIGKLDM